MKACTKCLIAKPFSEFHPAPGGEGLRTYCKACIRAQNRERWRERRRDDSNFRERINAARRAKSKSPAGAAQRWQEHQEQQRLQKIVGSHAWARRQLHFALRRGEVIKPDACEDCARHFPRDRIQGHHDDYAKPLEVVWLCSLCHGRRHWLEEAA